MEETAVEWLIEQLFELRNPTLNQIEIMKQAKEIEKKQQGYSEQDVEDAYDKGFKDASERSYSEEDLNECYEFAMENVQLGRNGYEWVTFEEWFKHLKRNRI